MPAATSKIRVMLKSFFLVGILLVSASGIVSSQESDIPVAQPVTSAATDTSAGEAPQTAEQRSQSVSVRYFGHSFIYLTGSTGVRLAFDPYSSESVGYSFPLRLPADLVLITNEAADHSAGDQLFGSPTVFRSITAIGMNRGRGLLFRGVQVNRSPREERENDFCTAFSIELDGIRFCHLGTLADTLIASQRRLLKVNDVVFLPIGNRDFAVEDMIKVVGDLQAKVVFPIKYRTKWTPNFDLRKLDDFLAENPLPVRRIESQEVQLSRSSLPSEPTVYVLQISQ